MEQEESLSRFGRLGEIARRLHDERLDLQEAFNLGHPDGIVGYWHWLNYYGPDPTNCTHADEVRERLWPVPPHHLRARVVGEDTSIDDFRRAGLTNWWRMRTFLVEGGFDPDGGGKVLDYGVGCGRLLRYFSLYAPSTRFFGTDVDTEAVEWCRENLPFGTFELLQAAPPAPFEDGFFDAVYSFSVFSHLPRPAHHAWLAELARITRPGSVLVVTLMGLECARQVVEEEREYPHPEVRVMRKRMRRLRRDGFAFFPYKQLTFQLPENNEHFAKWNLAEYGTAYVTEGYVREYWTRWFDIVAFHEAPDGWQDYVVLRRSSR